MTYLPRANEPVVPHTHDERMVTENCPICQAQFGGGGGTGTVGPAGPPGPAGPAGPAGADGRDGVDGAPGRDGIDGAPGAPGPAGADGAPGPQGIQGIQGPPGMGITFKGSIATVDDLPATGNTQGDMYSVETPAPATGWVWDDADQAFVDAGPIQGPQGVEGPASTVPGPQGPKGDPGDPAVLPISTATVLGGVKVGAGLAVTADGVLSASGGGGAFLPLAGGTMTGTITVPSGSVALAINGTNYNMLGGSGGVAFRSGTTNISNHTATEVVNYVPLTTPGTGVGVRFGSGGPNLSKSGTMIASSAPITVAAAPATDLELANKAYVDSKAGTGGTAYTLPPATATVLGGVKQGTGVTIAADGTLSASGGGGVANPVNGSVSGMTLWMGTQAAYDAIATKDAKTAYMITG